MIITSVLIPLLQIATAAPEPPQSPRAGRHSIELGFGLLDHTRGTVAASGTGTTISAQTGIGGSLAYTYWLADDLGVSAQVLVLSVEAAVRTTGTLAEVRSVTVVPLLLGVKYQPFRLHDADRLRPYLSAAVGPYVGTDAGVTSGIAGASVGSRTEAAVGGRAGIGCDFLVSHRVMLGLGAGYHLMTDFDQPIGAKRNYSGPDLSLSVGLLLGGGR